MSSIRRWSVGLVLVVAGCASLPGGGSQSRQKTGDLTEPEAVAHVLSRLTFGARPGDAERVRAIGIDKWIEAQLHPETVADSGLAVALAPMKVWTVPAAEMASALTMAPAGFTRVPAITAPVVVTAFNTNNAGVTTKVNPDSLQKLQQAQLQARIANLIVLRPGGPTTYLAGKVIRAQVSERQLVEVMADFWENHFSVFANKMPAAVSLAELSREAIRPRVLGKFRDLLGAVAHSPAMLFYLDNQLSRNAAINENYARELMELHTLGVDGGYTQDDVIEVARALTGWTLTSGPATRSATGQLIQAPRAFTFDASMHDPGAKKVLGHDIPAGGGAEDGEQVLDIIARHPSTAKYISTKLARRFVSDSPPPALVERAAATFLKSDGDIAEVVRTIVTSPEFFSKSAMRAKVKTPFELVVSTRRVMNVPADTTVATVNLLGVTFNQPMFGKQTPDGWPDVGSAWINSGALMKRILYSADVAEGRAQATSVSNWPGWSALSSKTHQEQVDGVISMILGGIASPATRSAMLASAATGDARLREVVAIALGSPEFQHR
jgi:uncharacterized protein (DUF1800 family)